MEHAECIVVGAGVVGLAVGASLCRAGVHTLVVEQHEQIGSEVSSRNSEVIHAGIYYPWGSLKAQLCVEGKALLYEHCKRHAVPYRRTGKLIVATIDREIAVVRQLIQKAKANGVDDLVWLDAEEVAALEPEVQSRGGALSPSTGIVDSHALMLSLQGIIEHHGGAVVLDTQVTAIESGGTNPVLETADFAISADWVINCGGLNAPSLASDTPGTPRAYYAKGHYFTYADPSPFSRLIYPVPSDGGLGVHATLDLAGQTKFGPDVHWINEVNYDFDSTAYDNFVQAIQLYFPSLDEAKLQEGYTGIRPKIAGPGSGFTDFRIEGPTEHGVRGRINLLGIESPGLTAALAIGRRVAAAVSAKA